MSYKIYSYNCIIWYAKEGTKWRINLTAVLLNILFYLKVSNLYSKMPRNIHCGSTRGCKVVRSHRAATYTLSR